jgi:hypothetical protein
MFTERKKEKKFNDIKYGKVDITIVSQYLKFNR